MPISGDARERHGHVKPAIRRALPTGPTAVDNFDALRYSGSRGIPRSIQPRRFLRSWSSAIVP